MNITEFSRRSSLTTHTLRYYEKLGLLNNISRDSSGHRCYSQADIDWVMFIKRLKDTGMPLEQIRLYASLRAEGQTTNEQRRMLLQKHRDALNARIKNELEHLRMLDLKIHHYNSKSP